MDIIWWTSKGGELSRDSRVSSLAFGWRTGLSHKVFVESARLQVEICFPCRRHDLVEPTRSKFPSVRSAAGALPVQLTSGWRTGNPDRLMPRSTAAEILLALPFFHPSLANDGSK